MDCSRATAGPALVILAAGASTRLGEPKALARLRGEPALVHLLRAGLALEGPAPLVITGPDHAPIAALLDDLRESEGLQARAVPNPDWAQGRSVGLALASQQRPECDLCVAPVDCPLVSAEVFRALAQAWSRAGRPPRGWLGPTLETGGGGRHGHPILLGRELVSELDTSSPLKALRAQAQPLLSVTVGDPAILDNLDRPEDLERLRQG